MTEWVRCRLPRVGLILAAASLMLTPSALSAQDAEDLTNLEVRLDRHPTVEMRLTVPATLTGGTIEPSSISIQQNGTPVAADITPIPTAGLEVVLLFDTSGSMRDGDAIGAAKAAAASFITEMPPDVAIGIVSFDNAPALVSPLTSDREALLGAVAGLVARGETALFDAIVFGRTLFSGGTADRQFVLLSDGGDTVSNSTLDDALDVTRDIRTSTVELITFESDQEALRQLSTAGGGQLISATDPSGLDALFRRVAQSLVNRFQMEFVTTASGPTTYTITITTPEDQLTVTRTVDLRAVTTTTPTTQPATTTTTSDPAPTTTVAAPPVTEVAPPAPGETATESRSGDATALLVIGAIAMFLALTLLVLIAWPYTDPTAAGRRQLGVRRRSRVEHGGEALTERLSALADDALERGGRRRGLTDALDVAGVALRPGEFVVVTIAFAITAAAVLLILFGPLGALLALIGAPLVARWMITFRADRRRREFADQLPDVLQLIVSALRAGFALPQALDAVANQAAEPARSEFQRIMFESRVGRDISEALRASADRMHSPDFEWVVAAFDINREVGGELAQVLENVADTIRERQQLRRQVRSLSAEARMSAYVLTGLPIVVTGLIFVTNRSYFDPLRSGGGLVVIVLAVILMIIGWIWMRRMVRAEV